MATKATSTKGVQLYVKKSSAYVAFAEVSSVPEIGKSSDKIDVTHLNSDMKEYVPDIPDFSSDLEFTMNAVPSGESDSNYDLIMELDEDTTYEWKIGYPQQKVQCTLKGQFSWRMGAAEVSSKQDIILTIIPRSAPVWSQYSSTASLTYAEGA